MGLRRFFKKVRHAPAAPVEVSVVVDQRIKESDQIPEPATDAFRGTHPLVKPREETRLHREVISPDLGRAGLTLEIGPYFHPVVKGPNARYLALPQSVWRTILRTGRFRRDSDDFKEALVARERCFRSKR